MKKGNSLKILSILIFIFIVNSCKDSSNPIGPINNVHSKILFLVKNQLAIINADGSNFQFIPIQGKYSFDANLSSDASKIVYGSVDTTYQQILLYNLYTNTTTKITDDNLFHEDATFSNDGKSIVYITADDWKNQIFMKNLEIDSTKQLTWDFNTHQPRFSPDDSKIIFWGNVGTDGEGVVVMESNGDNVRFIAQGYYPEFSPDGKRILFQKFIPPYDEGLYIMNADGSNEMFLSLIPFQTSPRFSPDGSKIVFSKFTTNFDIYLINIDGSNLVNITNDEAGETQPVFTSDGSKIVFVQYDSVSRINKLCSMNIDGTDRKVIFEDSTNYGIKIF